MTPPNITEAAKTARRAIHGCLSISNVWDEPTDQVIQLAINSCVTTATAPLEKENAELKQSVHELNETLRRAGWGQGEIDSSYSIYEELETERDQLQQSNAKLTERVKFLENRPPDSFRSAPDCESMKCGHNSYWRTHYGNCMACRAEGEEKERDALTQKLAMVEARYSELSKASLRIIEILEAQGLIPPTQPTK